MRLKELSWDFERFFGRSSGGFQGVSRYFSKFQGLRGQSSGGVHQSLRRVSEGLQRVLRPFSGTSALKMGREIELKI